MTSVQGHTLRDSIGQALKGSPDLAALMGGVRIFDRTPEAASFPYITLGESALRDWSAGPEDGAERRVTVHVWSPFGGKKHMQDIIKAVKAALDELPLATSRDRIALRHEFSGARLDPEGDSFHGIVRYRAAPATSQAAAA